MPGAHQAAGVSKCALAGAQGFLVGRNMQEGRLLPVERVDRLQEGAEVPEAGSEV